jgi:hypothetical protein
VSKQAESKMIAREGDVLVVSYGEHTIPIAQYANVKVGGLTYSRKLAEGDDVEAEYTRVYAFLKRRAMLDGQAKVDEAQAELARARGVR